MTSIIKKIFAWWRLRAISRGIPKNATVMSGLLSGLHYHDERDPLMPARLLGAEGSRLYDYLYLESLSGVQNAIYFGEISPWFVLALAHLFRKLYVVDGSHSMRLKSLQLLEQNNLTNKVEFINLIESRSVQGRSLWISSDSRLPAGNVVPPLADMLIADSHKDILPQLSGTLSLINAAGRPHKLNQPDWHQLLSELDQAICLHNLSQSEYWVHRKSAINDTQTPAVGPTALASSTLAANESQTEQTDLISPQRMPTTHQR
jgi:hypothetical protein